jgi:hypothetical protein
MITSRLEIFADKTRLVLIEESKDPSLSRVLWIGEAYNDQVPLLKREAKRATGHKVAQPTFTVQFGSSLHK